MVDEVTCCVHPEAFPVVFQRGGMTSALGSLPAQWAEALLLVKETAYHTLNISLQQRPLAGKVFSVQYLNQFAVVPK